MVEAIYSLNCYITLILIAHRRRIAVRQWFQTRRIQAGILCSSNRLVASCLGFGV